MVKGKKENSIFLAKIPYTWSQINTTKCFGGMHIYTFVFNNSEI